MKKAEAISILATSVRPREAKDRARYDEAVGMAIEALKCSETPKSSERAVEATQPDHNADSDKKVSISCSQENDLISRQAAIDAALEDVSDKRTHEFNAGAIRAANRIKSLPSVQPEVIRCKDCKWYGRVDKRRFYRGMDCLQKHIDTIVPDRDFCSKAERRGEKDE